MEDVRLHLFPQPLASGRPAAAPILGETYEDLGDREHALRWVEVALRGAVPPSRFENRPSLRTLVHDERYRQLVREIG
jgi:hypothetical protein